MVTDAEAIERYYRERYGKETTFIAYGADMRREDSTEALDELGLEPGGYFLYVSRLEPENNADLVVEAFEQARVEQKLVMVGDAPYADAYIKTLKQSRDPRIVFPGAVYGKRYRELQSHCLAYIHATEVGGAHPALIEALGRRALTLYLEVPESVEVAAEAGLRYRTRPELTSLIERVAKMSDDERRKWGEQAAQRTRDRYNWEAIVSRYEDLFSEMTGATPR